MWLYAINNCDQFFNASVCHVCKWFGAGINLKKCAGCRLIYYCSEDHQKVHWPNHKTFCKAVKAARENCAAELSAARGEQERMQLLWREVTSRLGRKLMIYETQMFKYARMCRFCGEVSNDKLKDCKNCLCVSYCEEHENKHKNKDVCKLYGKAFRSEILFNMHIATPDWRLILIEPSTVENNMSDMATYLSVQSVRWKYEKDRELWEIEQSRHFTRVLSLYQGLKILGYNRSKEELVVHVIGANKKDVRTIHCFEILLHVYTSLKKLKLVLIGSEVEQYRPAERFQLCLPCTKEDRQFIVSQYDMLYMDYVKDEMKENEKPDVIVGFECGLHEHEIGTEEEIWAPSIKAVAEQNVPVILTCHSPLELDSTKEKIDLVLEKKISPFYDRVEKNPFASLRLFREYEFPVVIEYTENMEKTYYPVYGENQYLLLYKTLCQ